MLVDLSIVDMLLRYEMLPLTLDVEHFAKVKLLKCIETEGEDGYAVVSDFISSYDGVKPDGTPCNSLKDEILRCKNSPYTGGLIARYADNDFPAWAFIEVVSFGSFLYFYKFCANRFDDQRKSKMSNDRIQQIVTTLYAHRKLASQGVLEHRAKSLSVFVQRMNKHVDYYQGNLQVSTGFEFITKVISAWFPVDTD